MANVTKNNSVWRELHLFSKLAEIIHIDVSTKKIIDLLSCQKTYKVFYLL